KRQKYNCLFKPIIQCLAGVNFCETRMRRVAKAGLFMTLLPLLAVQASACSQAMCVNNGFETRQDFVVTVLHRDLPLAGVSVEVRTSADAKKVQRFSGTTDKQGQVAVRSLPPGEYWLEARMLGISAAYV